MIGILGWHCKSSNGNSRNYGRGVICRENLTEGDRELMSFAQNPGCLKYHDLNMNTSRTLCEPMKVPHDVNSLSALADPITRQVRLHCPHVLLDFSVYAG